MINKSLLTTLTLLSFPLICDISIGMERAMGLRSGPISVPVEDKKVEPIPAPVVHSTPEPAYSAPEPKKEIKRPEIVERKTEECSTSLPNAYVNLRHIEANGIGYKHGYSTLEFLFANMQNELIPFLDLRGHVFNNGKYAANVGFGFRRFGKESSRANGANIFYDYRREKKHNFQQIGVGLESLGAIWDFRANGYIPVGSSKSHFSDAKFYEFEGHEIIVQRKKNIAMYGVDGEVGAHLYRWHSIDLYTGVGPYYFVRDHKHALGGKARVSAGVLADKGYTLALEGTVSYDSLFKDIYQGQVSLTLPLGSAKKIKKNQHKGSCSDFVSLQRRLALPVVRDEIIVLKRTKKKTPAINPATGEPYTVFFVDNTSSSLGTYESPYPTLTEAEAAAGTNDIIYVFPGDGTTTGMTSGIILQEGQKLFGSGINQPLATSLGNIVLPAQSAADPRIANTLIGALGIVIPANNTEIAGFTFDAATGPAASILYQSSDPISNIVIRDNSIFSTIGPSGSGSGGGSGILIENLAGTLTVHNNVFIGGGAATGVMTTTAIDRSSQHYIYNNYFIDFETRGVDIDAPEDGSSTFAHIHNNAFIGNTGIGGPGGVSVSASAPNNSSASAIVEENSFTNIPNGNALSLTVTSGAANTGLWQVSENTFTTCPTSFVTSVDAVGQTACVIFNENTSDGSYIFDATNGVMKAAIADDNTGDLQVVGVIDLFEPTGFNCPN